jgi:dephospho-CoA kinase
MPALAITGNIGSGKTEFLHLLVKSLNATAFSADDENRRLLDSDPDVRERITAQFGGDCYLASGKADRARLFAIISDDPSRRLLLEDILHPRLEALWKPMAERHRDPCPAFFIAEIPLLYEKGLHRFFDRSMLVACSDSTRKQRLLNTRSLTPDQVGARLRLQEPQVRTIGTADHVIWNDGSPECLAGQAEALSRMLKNR